MSFEKLATLFSQTLHDLVPLLRLTVCFGIRLVANLTAKARVFESRFHSVLGDLETRRKTGSNPMA
jgi:hypothetical protein